MLLFIWGGRIARFSTAVLKTAECNSSVGSNPTLPAKPLSLKAIPDKGYYSYVPRVQKDFGDVQNSVACFKETFFDFYKKIYYNNYRKLKKTLTANHYNSS